MRRQRLLTALLLAGLAPLASAQPAARITLEQAMADPDWIGNAVEQAWWSWDGTSAYYSQKRIGATIRDTFRVPVTGGVAIPRGELVSWLNEQTALVDLKVWAGLYFLTVSS